MNYPDLSLYAEILLLQKRRQLPWVIENVQPFYTPLIPPTAVVGRHLFWSNFKITPVDIAAPQKTIVNLTVPELVKWLGLDYTDRIRYRARSNYSQVLRNCVHPLLGQHIYNCAEKNLLTEKYRKLDMFG